MDEEYVLRDFKNAKVTKQAVVTIDNIEHEVTPAQVQGSLLKAEDLNYMDNKIKNLYDKKLINKTVVELKTVAEEAPTQCEEGDLYYNTTTNLIYKATGNNVWGATGENPTSKYLYVGKTNSKLYYYDGQDFKSYGGGGGINLVTEEGTIPTELFIDTNSFATTGTEVVNSLNGNETNKAPSVQAVNDRFDDISNSLLNFSLTEIKVGKWLGDEVYAKIFTGTLDTSDTKYLEIKVLKVLKGCGFIENSLGQQFLVNSNLGNDRTNENRVIKASSGDLMLQYGTAFQNCSYEILVFYTKGADE